MPASSWALQDVFMRNFVFGPSYDSIKQFNFDRDLAALTPLSYAQDNVKADLSEFRAHGGKLILYTAGPTIRSRQSAPSNIMRP
jgi:hypothetical protein